MPDHSLDAMGRMHAHAMQSQFRAAAVKAKMGLGMPLTDQERAEFAEWTKDYKHNENRYPSA